MKVGPLSRFNDKPIALLYPGHRTLTVETMEGPKVAHGRRQVELALEAISGHVCYALDRLDDLRHTTGARSWECSTWRGRVVRMTHVPSGVGVCSLRGTLDDSPEPFTELSEALAWLRGYGVTPASIPSMAWQLFRASLSREVAIGFDENVGRAAFYGGRQGIKEVRTYSDVVAYDLRAAYPVAMASRPYALSLREVDTASTINPEYAGMALAEVYVPEELPYPPLPVRVMEGFIAFQHGFIRGVWPWVELAAAMELGCRVKVLRSWAPRREADLFRDWWPMVAEGRELPGGAGVVAKAVANSTWGQFGMIGTERGTRTWADDEGREPVNAILRDRRMPHEWTAHLAAETTARVRTRLLREGLYAPGCQAVHVDTDGIVVPSGSRRPQPYGKAPGEWRAKERIAEIDVRGPQLYRYRVKSSDPALSAEWRYNAAGIPADEAPAFFARSGPLVIPVEYRVGFDEPDGLARIADAARRAQVARQ